MKKVLEAKNVQEAKKEMMRDWKIIDENQIEFSIIEESTKGLFGIGGKKAVVEGRIKEPHKYYAKEFLNILLDKMNIRDFDLDHYTQHGDYNINIKVPMDFKSILIGKYGNTLNSLEYLTKIYINRHLDSEARKKNYNIHIDVDNYRFEKIQKLEEMANRLAEKVLVTGKNMEMRPMTARERKIIHMNFKNDPNINTFSRGQEPNRKIVLSSRKK